MYNSEQTVPPISVKLCHSFRSNCATFDHGDDQSDDWIKELRTNAMPQNVNDGGYNLDSDPLFLDAMNNDLRLKPYSPAINAGNNDSIPAGINTDLADTFRILDGSVDMGAYENPEGDCPDHPVLDNSYSPLHGTYLARTAISIEGVVEIQSTGDVVLNAPTVHISPVPSASQTFTTASMGLLEIQTDGCDIPSTIERIRDRFWWH